MTEVKLLLLAVTIHVLYSIYDLIIMARKGFALLSLKRSVNALRVPVHLVAILYFLLWAVAQVPAVAAWTDQMLSAPTISKDFLIYYVYAVTPLVYILGVFVCTVWIFAKSASPWLKYNARESLWLAERRVKLNIRISRIFGKKVGNFLVK